MVCRFRLCSLGSDNFRRSELTAAALLTGVSPRLIVRHFVLAVVVCEIFLRSALTLLGSAARLLLALVELLLGCHVYIARKWLRFCRRYRSGGVVIVAGA